jgi:V-type H+-transporting ATPase subunit D
MWISILGKTGKTHNIIIYRLKKVQGKKKRDTAARDAALALVEPPAEKSFDAAVTGEEGSTDLLSSKDDDVIF